MMENAKKIDCYTAARIAEAMNCWAGKEHRKQIVTANDILALNPIASYEGKHGGEGYPVFAFQWGDVTILALPSSYDGEIRIQNVCW